MNDDERRRKLVEELARTQMPVQVPVTEISNTPDPWAAAQRLPPVAPPPPPPPPPQQDYLQQLAAANRSQPPSPYQMGQAPPGQPPPEPPTVVRPGEKIPATPGSDVYQQPMHEWERHGAGPIQGGVFATPGGPGAGGAPTAPAARPGGGGGGFVDTMSPRAHKAWDAYFASKQQAVQAGLAPAQIAAEGTSRLYDRAGEALDLQERKSAFERAPLEERAGKLQGVVDAETARLSGEKIDSNRVLSNIGVGQKIMFVLAEGLMGFAGKPGAIMAQLNHMIDRDIEEQKSNLSHRRESLAANQSLLASTYRQLGDKEAAGKAAKAAIMDRLDLQLKSLAAQAQSPAAKEKADLLSAELQKEKAALLLQTEKRVTPSGPAQPKDAQSMQDRLVRTPDGRTVVARSPEEARTIRGKIGAVANIQANINEALALRQNASFVDLANKYSAVRKRLASLQNETAQLVTVNRGQGSMSEGDKEVAMAAIGSMSGVLGNNDDVLRATSDRFGKQLGREIDAMGGEQVQQGYTTDKQGRTVPTAEYNEQRDVPRQQVAPPTVRPLR